MNFPFDLVMIPVQLIVVFFTLYYFVLSFFGLFHSPKSETADPEKTFAILVAAHNESNVIGQLIDNFSIMNYPESLYDVYVIADNCTDNTAEVARNAGAKVMERFDPENRGKGFAMEWGFAKLFAQARQYDAIAVFDADNLVDPEFLRVMNQHLLKGETVIQGYLDAKNPTDTWVAGTFAICFWVVDHIWHLAKYNIGLSSCLGGTGMVISTDLLKRHGWGATCLTEDLEFTMKCLAEGISTSWAHEAIVYDEKPLTFMQSWNQRKRWAQGHFDVASRFIPKLFSEGVRRRDIRLLDGILHLLQPHFLILSTTFVVLSLIHQQVPFYTNILYTILPGEVWAVVAIGQYIFPLVVLTKIHAPLKSWFYMLLYPVFIYSWVPVTFIGYLHRHDKSWSHTTHSRSLSYNDVMGTFPKENMLTKQAAK
ncbi:MAG TPA: glycosyltransferase family 2 protein [Negativicutes bacterium]|nr:glycosyltransferase family 2 protein [Negativicutes bacterium]